MINEKIKSLAEKYLPEIQEIRRELHKHPELGFHEFETAKIIKRELDKLGIPYKSEVAKTGVVGIIKGKYEGKTVMLRGDMDALPLVEETNIDYKSEINGCMHACGHDGHTAGLIGAAKILNDLKDELHGTVKLIFQPAEEGPGGAEPMIKEGVLEDPHVDMAFGCHIWPTLKAGSVAYRPLEMMSHPSEFNIKILGRGGHGSLPELTIDPVVIGAEIVSAIQNIRSRFISTHTRAVISVTTIHAGTARNIIPDTLTLGGTIRSFSKDLTTEILEKIEQMVKGITEAYGAKYEMETFRMYEPLVNDEKASEIFDKAARDFLGDENVIVMKNPLMGSEDFGYFSQAVPSCFFLFGVLDEQEKIETNLHHPKLRWDDKNLKTSSGMLAKVAYEYLNNNK